MEEYSNTFKHFLNTETNRDTTINECMVANIFYLATPDEETVFNNELKFIKGNSRKEYKQLKAGELIILIVSFRLILNERKQYYLKNHWGINVDELITDIEQVKQEFISLTEEYEEEFSEAYRIIENTKFPSYFTTLNSSNPNSSLFEGFGMCYHMFDESLPFMNLFYAFCEQHEELKHKIHDAATINSEEYIAELRLYIQQNIQSNFFLSDNIEWIKAMQQMQPNDNVLKRIKAILKKEYNAFVEKKNLPRTESLSEKEISFDNNRYINPLNNLVDIDSVKAVLHILCSNKKYIYFTYHTILQNNQIKENHKHRPVGKPLYDGYIKWCKKNEIQPLISIERIKLIEYPTDIVNTHSGQFHFPKKRFINNPNNLKREELNKTFLQNLLKGMIDEKIIAPDTNEEHFFFVFGYGEDGIENFKPIKILKPNTNYTRESGKRTIIYLLKELMEYSDDEIRPTLGKNRHLVINSCFEVSPLFKSSDFGDIPASEASEIIKASELLKIKRIFETALNDTKGTIQ